MKRSLFAAGTATLVVCSTLVLAQDAPENLLPPGFANPAPAPTAAPAPAPTPASGQPAGSAAPAIRPGAIVQPLPGEPGDALLTLDNLPTLEELQKLNSDEIDELLGLKPKYDIPPGARRSLARVGIIAPDEGGLPIGSLAQQPAGLVRAILKGTRGPLVSRWGHILLRRALASRLTAPDGMDPVEFAALRAALLNRMGEHTAARALVQDVDTANFDPALTEAAVDAYVATADIVGACPVVRHTDSEIDDARWLLLEAICNAYAGEGTRAESDLRRILAKGRAAAIDVRLAQRYAGAAGIGRSAVNIEWSDVTELTPWRFALANALGEEIPDALTADLSRYYRQIAAIAPMLPPAQRAASADLAARTGILSASAMIDLYSQIYAAQELQGDIALTASSLREAYVGSDPVARLSAMRNIWEGGADGSYGRYVLTAYAAARLQPDDDFADAAAPLIASMLSAGLDRDAVQWAGVVPKGSVAWGLLALARPTGNVPVNEDQLDSFVDQDPSSGQRKSAMLIAGLAGLGRIDPAIVPQFAEDLGINLARQTHWTQTIAEAATVNNRALVSMLAALGMQGSSWDKMTALHLYHIVAALRRVGLEAEARMIAAEAVARA